jgi:hypothetical protein
MEIKILFWIKSHNIQFSSVGIFRTEFIDSKELSFILHNSAFSFP